MVDVQIETLDGLYIRGSHVRASVPRAICLFLHGITTDRNEHLDFHKILAHRVLEFGISSLLIDFRGHGSSDGRQVDFSPVGQLIDTISSINYLQMEYDLTRLPLTIIGTSFGAGPALMSAFRYPAEVKRLFLIAPVLDYRQTFLEPSTDWAKASFNDKALQDLNKKGYLVLDGVFQVGARLVYEMNTIDLGREASRIQQPITIVHGRDDSMVPVLTSIEFARRIPRAQLIQMDNMDHGFSVPNDESGTQADSQQNLKAISAYLSEYALGFKN